MNVADLREDYRRGELRRSELSEDPFEQFARWFTEAAASGAVPEPNAMTLATADAGGRVGARTVLLKGWDHRGFAFFTNYTSAKARQIEENSQVALLFPWLTIERQISITGRAIKVSLEESHAYFQSRPRASQLGAWASEQSHPIESRGPLERRYAEIEQQYAEGEVPLPDFWGGYRVEPLAVEFWQGRTSRLHDRFLYERNGEGWTISRLSP